jgi:hypothetical protein
MRLDVYTRDDFTCQFCDKRFDPEALTIDHLVPISNGGLDEMTNWVTACGPCNQLKASLPLADFAKSLDIQLQDLPVHGDPVIDNRALPIQIRVLRKRIFDRARLRGQFGGKSAQKKLEKAYRREFWQTPLGRKLEGEWPSLPGQVRIMIPEIESIADSPQDFLLLLELAKSANTRNLIGAVLSPGCNALERVMAIRSKSTDAALVKRLDQALLRFKKALCEHGLAASAF